MKSSFRLWASFALFIGALHLSQAQISSASTFELSIDHQENSITVRAWFFAAKNNADTRSQLKAIVKFWKSQSAKFHYRLDGQDYVVHFDIQKAEGFYSENGYFLPSEKINPAFLHQVQIVPASIMKNMDKRRGKQARGSVVGYAQANFIFIASDMAHHTHIGIHESGHILGLDHHAGGIMEPHLEKYQMKLTQIAIDQIIDHKMKNKKLLSL